MAVALQKDATIVEGITALIPGAGAPMWRRQ
jgi:hypothetical protein